MNWADELIGEYKEGKKALRELHSDSIDSPDGQQDRSQINSMMDGMDFSIKWMQTGREPGTHRGAGMRGVYQFEDMDILPDINEHLRAEREQLMINGDIRRVLVQVFRLLSDRERQCYIMYEAEGMSMSEIGLKLGISKWTARTHIDRAREKVNNVVSHDCRTGSEG